MPEDAKDQKSATDDTKTDDTDYKAKFEHMREEMRKQEKRAKENAEAAQKLADAEKRIADIEAAKLTEAEKAEKRLADLEKRISEGDERAKRAEVAALKARVGAEAGLPPAFIDRLQGDDEDAIKADAESLLGAIPQEVKATWPELGQGGGEKTQTPSDNPLLDTLSQKLGL